MTVIQTTGDGVVALIPAAGSATRLGSLPCSKEILPFGFQRDDTGLPRPRAVVEHLLGELRGAGVRRGFVILREGKWDIPSYLGPGGRFDMDLAYLLAAHPYGTPYSLDQAYPFLTGQRVALGFPDIVYRPEGAFTRLLERQAQTDSDVVLGLFPAERPEKMDMVACGARGEVRDIVIKPPQTDLRMTWILAVWGPSFTEYMHAFLSTHLDAVRTGRFPDPASSREPYVGDVVRAALYDGLSVGAVSFADGACIDIGTPDSLQRASRQWPAA